MATYHCYNRVALVNALGTFRKGDDIILHLNTSPDWNVSVKGFKIMISFDDDEIQMKNIVGVANTNHEGVVK